MDQLPPLTVSPSGSAAPRPLTSSVPNASAPASTGHEAGALHGIDLVDASATLSSGRSMFTDIVLGSDNQVSQIRVIDAVTHQVIAASPPDTIARAQQEILAYQGVAQARQIS